MPPRNYEPIDALEPGEVSFIIELLAAMAPMSEIKNRLFELSGKIISEKTVRKVQIRYANVVQEQMKAYLNNIEGSPLAHPRIRLDLLYRIVQDCLTQRPDKSIRVDPENFEVVSKADNSTAVQAIKLAAQDMAALENIKIQKKDKGIDDDDSESYEVDTGMGA